MSTSPISAWMQTPTLDLKKSRQFYESLGFQELEDSPNFYWDGRMCVEINPDPIARTSIKVAAGILTEETPIRHPLVDPNGVKLYADTESSRKLPTIGDPFGKLGPHYSIFIETHDLDATLEWWKARGFVIKIREFGTPYIELGGGIDIDPMKLGDGPHICPSPAFTYFNAGKNPAVIANIRAANIPITQELTKFSKTNTVDDVIIHDPGLTGFFVFNDELDKLS